MASLQVKNLPAELHAQLRERAAAPGQSVSEYITRLLRQDLRRPSMAQWIAARSVGEPRPEVDAVALVDAVGGPLLTCDGRLSRAALPGLTVTVVQ